MVACKSEERNGVLVLRLDGGITVQDADGLKQALAEAVQQSDCIEVDLSEVHSADVACLQLFCSAHRISGRLGKSFSISAFSGAFVKASRDAGYHRISRCNLNAGRPCLFG